MTTAKKRIYGLITAVVFAMTLLPLSGLFDKAGAAAAGTEEMSVTFNLSGNGTDKEPYKITSKTDLEQMKNAVNANYTPDGKTAAASAHYELTADITELGSWTPIGKPTAFAGTFDGKGHKISLSIDGNGKNRASTLGLFGTNKGTIKNLHVSGTIVNGGFFAGLIVAINDKETGTIENCYADGSVAGSYAIGGIVGINDGTIKNCFANVTSTSAASSGSFGAIAGTNGNNAITNSCYKTANLPAVGTATGDTAKTIVALDDADIKSGKAAWILRQEQTDGMYWGQKLPEDTEPKLYSDDTNRVYKAEFVLKTTTEEVTVAEEFANKNGTFAKPTVTYDKDGQTAGDKWYENLDDEDKSEYSFDTLVTKDIKLYNSGSYKDYTITLNLNGGTLAAGDDWVTNDNGKTYTKTYNKGTDTFTLPTPTAPKDQKFAGWVDGTSSQNEKVTIAQGTTGDKSYSAVYKNAIGPVITVKLGNDTWKGMLTDYTVYVNQQNAVVTVSATDDQDAEIKTIYYMVSDEVQTVEQLAAKSGNNYWLVYNGTSVVVNPSKTNRRYVYFKAADKDGNVSYASSAAIVFDLSKPTISGIANGSTYCESIEFTVNDANLSKVIVGDQVLFDESGVIPSADSGIVAAMIGDKKFSASFTHTGTADVKIKAIDKAGNETEYTVKINGQHVAGRSVTEMTRAASCVNIGEGIKLTYCKNCGLIMERNDHYTEPMLAHRWSPWKETSSVLCGDKTSTRKCQFCGLTETKTEGGHHEWDTEYTIDMQATCLKPGQMSKHCKVCGISNPEDTVEIPTLAHQPGDAKTIVVKEATCTTDGATETVVLCANCLSEMGRTYTVVPATGHDFTEWEKIATPSDPESGTMKRECKKCGYPETASYHTEHKWGATKEIDREPTCTSDGSKSYHCENCGSTSDPESIPALGHDEETEAVREAVIPATCTEAGRYNDVIYCKRCKEAVRSKPVTVPAEGHKFGEWEEVKTANGEVNEQRSCTVCGITETRGMDLENHKWNTEYTIDVEPTCTTEGSRSIHCSVCGLTKPGSSETIKANDHTWGEWKEISSPDCDDSGAQERECTVCHTKETKNLSPNGHTWNEDFTIDKEATCTTDGSKSIYCTKCGAVKESETIPAKGHSFGEWVEVISKSTGEVNEERTCTVCGFTETRGADLVNHKWDKDYTIDVKPTCTTEGSKSIHCSVCGLKKDSEVIPALGHDFGEWKDISSPDCDDEGTQERECKVCGTKETNNLSAKGHTWEDKYTVDKPATCFEDGSESIHCSKCDAVKDSRTIPAPGHHTPAAERKGAKAATATEDGYTGDVVCEVCGEVLEKGEVIPATMGNIDVIPESGKGAPALKLTESIKLALEDAALTDAEKEALSKGANIDIVLSIDDATSTVTADDKALTDKAIADKYTVGQYVTIDITKTIDGKEFAVTQLGKEISLTIEVPESLRAEGRTFAIVRLHDGKADILSDTDSDANTITFKTDKFSVYAIVYADKASEPTPPAITEPDSSKPDDSKTEDSKPDESKPDSSLNDNSPATGGDFSLVFVILAAAVLGTICVIRKENKAR